MSSDFPCTVLLDVSGFPASVNRNAIATAMLAKDDQNVKKLYLYIELPYLCPNYSIFSQVARYIYIQLPKYICRKFQYIYPNAVFRIRFIYEVSIYILIF